MNKNEIVAFKKDNKVYTLCKKCKTETFKSEDKESIQGIDWAFDNGYEAQYKGDIYATKDIESGDILYHGSGVEEMRHTQKEISPETKLAAYPRKQEDMFLKEKMPKFLSEIPLPELVTDRFDLVIHSNYQKEITGLQDQVKEQDIINVLLRGKNKELKDEIEKLNNNSNIKFADLTSLQADLTNLKIQLDFALEMNKKLKSRNLFQRILNS